jgi:chromosome segregation ATPase
LVKVGDELDYQTLITVACTVGAFAVGYFAFRRDKDNDLRSDASELAVIKTQLSSISSGINDIRIDNKANERRLSEYGERLIRVEESSKQAHKRIDHIENKGGIINEN